MIDSLRIAQVVEIYAGWSGHRSAVIAERDRKAAREAAFRMLKGAGTGPLRVEHKPGTPQFADRWEAECLDRVPRRWQVRMASGFVKRGARQSPVANAWLREQSDTCAGFRIGLGATDDDVIAVSILARHC